VPGLAAAQFTLATLYDSAGEFAKAIARYEAVLEQSPESVIALNNLAYILAVKTGDLANALPLAEKAHRLAPGSGDIADTLGWIHLMSGNSAKAVALLMEASRLEPDHGEIRAHLAEALAATGNVVAAREHALKALALDPRLSSRASLRDILDAR
jgi:Flp pilus assembly protein TadD